MGVRVSRPAVSRAAAGFSAVGAVVPWGGVSPWRLFEGGLRFDAAGVVICPRFVPFPPKSAVLARLGGRPHHVGLSLIHLGWRVGRLRLMSVVDPLRLVLGEFVVVLSPAGP